MRPVVFRVRGAVYQKYVVTILGGPGISSTIFVCNSTCRFFFRPVAWRVHGQSGQKLWRCEEFPAAWVPYWVIPAAAIRSSPVLESKTRETIA